MTKKIGKFKDNWKNAFIIFTIAAILSYQVSSYGGEWEEEIKESASYKIQVVQDTPFNKYFYYYSILFEKTGEDTASFSGSETISYISNRAIYEFLLSMNFSEKIWRIEGNGKLRNVSNTGSPRNDATILDEDNPKTPHPRKDFYWDLVSQSGYKITCDKLGVGSYKVEHSITAIVEYGIPKPQTPALYTYFDCVGDEI